MEPNKAVNSVAIHLEERHGGAVGHDREIKKPIALDEVHGDEAVKVIASYSGGEEWTAEEEKQLVRKIDRRLLIFLCLSYGFQYYDKAMFSQAAIFGMRDDLNLTVGNRYSFSASIFYLGFICGAYPAVVLSQRFRVRYVAGIILCIWGAVLMCAAACKTYQGIYAQRFFLGFLEAGIAPIFMLVVGSWYKKNEQAFRMGIWYCCTGYISIFSPLVNYGLGHITGGTLAPWQYMFLFAGALTVLWSFVIFYKLPGDPITATGFTERERYIAVARVRSNNTGVRNVHFKPSQVLEGLLDAKFWLVFAMAFLMMIANGPQSTYQAIIVAGFGFSSLNSLLLLMPFGFIIGSIELGAPYLAYKIPNIRTYLIVLCQCLTVMSSLLLWILPRSQLGGLLVGVYFLGSFAGSYVLSMTLSIANTAGYTKRSFVSAAMFIGYCLGNVMGPILFKSKDAPRYVPAWVVVVVTSSLTACLTMVYRFLCIWENRRRDRTGSLEGFEHAYEDDLTDKKNPQFRYVY
ncbi:uncharacterized protein Z519_12299 [Cladophialophora bantiana CBS 173.52]|uniref:Major facilitator superfamily (MFS) profile domain-containing protein n=1 Tax=Cladophialophora bantiana (strain ATCC 10958 / CBS 173.52 / CDC B-1940 / NIH 8579) TaxID=1442370 RepID=A0A0D2H1N5_CLAB1|nr:uncharacterized protein Z519_12299 [Cladophialophora bantiana CBS 173.52]KIW87188.1 hypothetical protein Z519_12299 [Cladophialophora bantiana CBS 173.52]